MKSSYTFGESSNSRTLAWPLIVLVVVAVLITGTIGVGYKAYLLNLRPLSSAAESQQINIPSGSSAKEIAKILEEAKLIRSAWAFELYVRLNNALSSLQAGTYPLRPNQSIEEVVSIITNGKVSTDYVTILPGKRVDQIRSTLINYGYSEADVEAALDPKRYADHPVLAALPAGASLEGYIFPETFQRTSASNPQDIVKASLDEMGKALTPDIIAGFERQGLTVHQGITLASIVVLESGSEEDKATIAQVFLRRLQIGMQLGSDVTALYGAIVDGVKLPENPTQAVSIALAHDSPYNTRRHAGMPPGPISNVNLASLKAVANPSATDYLFFVAGDPDSAGNTGKTYFARTVQEHEANVAKYCKILCN